MLLNLVTYDGRNDCFTYVLGDARNLPFKDGAFDVVFSNSLIEHLFTFDQQQKFAAEAGGLHHGTMSKHRNQHFFLEPHLLTPFIHWLPRQARARLLRNFTVRGLVTRPTPEDCQHFVDELRLLTKRDLRRLFPEAEIWHERVLGMSKSLMAVKRTP